MAPALRELFSRGTAELEKLGVPSPAVEAGMLLEAVSEVVLAIVEMLPDFVQAITTLLPEFIQQIVSETSLDTLCAWLDMYDEARYVASLDSDEPELKEFNAQYNESIRHGFGRKENEVL